MLKKLGLPVTERWWWQFCREILDAIHELDGIRHKFRLSNGRRLVKVNSFAQRERSGSPPNRPRWAIAYKYAAERVETRLKDIVFRLGALEFSRQWQCWSRVRERKHGWSRNVAQRRRNQRKISELVTRS